MYDLPRNLYEKNLKFIKKSLKKSVNGIFIIIIIKKWYNLSKEALDSR